MSRLSHTVACTIFLAVIGLSLGVAVENIPGSANANDASQIVAPLARVLLHDKLHTTIRTATEHVDHSPAPSKIDGKFVGKYEQGTAGSGKYTGTFRGTASPKKTRVTFGYTVDGEFKYTDVDLTYSASVSGLAKIKNAKHVFITADYESDKLDGTIHGKKITDAKNRGVFKLYASGKRLQASDIGHFAITIDGKRLSANYKLVLYGDTVGLTMRGMYDGEKFFVKYAASLNIIKLGLQMNPFMITRNYGTVTGTANGKKFTQKYDISGMQMLDITK